MGMILRQSAFMQLARNGREVFFAVVPLVEEMGGKNRKSIEDALAFLLEVEERLAAVRADGAVQVSPPPFSIALAVRRVIGGGR